MVDERSAHVCFLDWKLQDIVEIQINLMVWSSRQGWELEYLGSIFHSATVLLCDFMQVA